MRNVTLILEGTIGGAVAVCRLLSKEIESGEVEFNAGTWTQPITVKKLTLDEAEALESIWAENGFKSTRK